MSVDLLDSPLATVNGGLGSVTAPPSRSISVTDAQLGVPAVAAVTAGVLNSQATSKPTGVNAEAEVTGATLSVPLIDAVIGGPILSTGTSVISASADCGPGVKPTALFGDTVDLRVAGQPVTLDVNGEAVVNVTALGLPVGTVTLRTDVSTTSTETAEATALIATVNINVLTVGSVNGEVRIAEASCEKADEVAAEAPTATTIDPDSGPVEGGTTVTIGGSGFIPGDTSITIGGITVPVGEVTVGGDGVTLTFTTPPHAEGPVEVTVTTPNGTTDPLTYTYVDDADTGAPVITGIDPDQGPVAGGTVVVLTGTDFLSGETTITIGDIEIPASEVAVNGDGTTATFTTPPHAAGPVDVTATTGNGTSEPLTFTYVDDETESTTITDIEPNEGPVEGGTTATITGTCFVAGETTVTIDGVEVPASEVTVNEEGTSLTFVTPAHEAGQVDVFVTAPCGESDAVAFTYVGEVIPGPPSEPGNNNPGNDNPGNGPANNGGSSNPDTLPRTGSDTTRVAVAGVLTVLAGGALLGLRRRFV